jgi:hypothetical protein
MSEENVSTDLGTVIAHHLQAIARAVARADGLTPQEPEPAPEPQQPGEDVFLSLDGALDLGNGSRLIPPSAAGQVRWIVLQELPAEAGEAGGLEWKGALSETLDPKGFVTEAYRLLLDREPDPQGLADYAPVLASPGGHQEVLRLLASSAEASSLARQLILAPESMLAEER